MPGKAGNLKRFYQLGGLVIQVEATLPLLDSTFASKFHSFLVSSPQKAEVLIKHFFSFPPLDEESVGPIVYEYPPWVIRDGGQKWHYFCYSPWEEKALYLMAIVSRDFSQINVYHPAPNIFLRGGLPSLTAFPTDQVLLAQVFPQFQGAYFHAAGLIHEGRGLVFLGPSGEGKSSITKLFKQFSAAQILCDDRVIIRQGGEKWRVYGTWSHGEVPDVSSSSAPLQELYFLKQGKNNRRRLITSKFEVTMRLIDLLVKPHPISTWWERVITICQSIAQSMPAYELEFDLSGEVVKLLTGCPG